MDLSIERKSASLERPVPAARSGANYFTANYDPFSFYHYWNTQLCNSEFGKDLQRLLKNNVASATKNSGDVDIALDDMCVHALFASYSEDFAEQRRVQDSVGFICTPDLTCLQSLFKDYPQQTKQNFTKSMIFSMSWFARLGQKYAANGLEGHVRSFPDFAQLYAGDHTSAAVLREIKACHGLLKLDFRAQTYGRSEITVDFQKERSYLETDDLLLTGSHPRVFLSERLAQDRPYDHTDRLSFIMSTGYREQWYPLLNVSKILIRTPEGTIRHEARD